MIHVIANPIFLVKAVLTIVDEARRANPTTIVRCLSCLRVQQNSTTIMARLVEETTLSDVTGLFDTMGTMYNEPEQKHSSEGNVFNHWRIMMTGCLAPNLITQTTLYSAT
jgi:hypothetical protein